MPSANRAARTVQSSSWSACWAPDQCAAISADDDDGSSVPASASANRVCSVRRRPGARSSVTASARRACRGRYQPRRSLPTSTASDSSARALVSAAASIELTVPSKDSGTGRPATARAARTCWAMSVVRRVRSVSMAARLCGIAARSSAEAGCVDSSAATSCSVKNGLPSARSYSASRSGARRAPSASDVASSADSARLSGPRRSSMTPGTAVIAASQPRVAGDRSGSSQRQLTATAKGPPRPPSTR